MAHLDKGHIVIYPFGRTFFNIKDSEGSGKTRLRTGVIFKEKTGKLFRFDAALAQNKFRRWRPFGYRGAFGRPGPFGRRGPYGRCFGYGRRAKTRAGGQEQGAEYGNNTSGMGHTICIGWSFFRLKEFFRE
jgi:hypothetical protein